MCRLAIRLCLTSRIVTFGGYPKLCKVMPASKFACYQKKEIPMKNRKKYYLIIGILCMAASTCFILGMINHILNTGEGIISSALLALGFACIAGSFLSAWKKK